MADAKDAKKEGAPPKDPQQELIWFVFMLLILGALFSSLTQFSQSAQYPGNFLGNISSFFMDRVVPVLKFVAYILSAVFAIGIEMRYNSPPPQSKLFFLLF